MYSGTRLYNAAASSPSRPREGDSLAITRAVIGQFSGPYCPVRTAKI